MSFFQSKMLQKKLDFCILHPVALPTPYQTIYDSKNWRYEKTFSEGFKKGSVAQLGKFLIWKLPVNPKFEGGRGVKFLIILIYVLLLNWKIMDRFFIELVLTLGTRNIIENCCRRKKAAFVKKAATRRIFFFLFIVKLGHLESFLDGYGWYC